MIFISVFTYLTNKISKFDTGISLEEKTTLQSDIYFFIEPLTVFYELFEV